MSIESEVAALKRRVEALEQALIQAIGGGSPAPPPARSDVPLRVPCVEVVDDSGQVCIRLHASEGRGYVDVMDTSLDDPLTARLCSNESGGQIALYNQSGVCVAEVSAHEDGEGELILRDDNSTDHTRIGCNAHGGGLISVFYADQTAVEMTSSHEGRGEIHVYGGETPHTSIEADEHGDGTISIFNRSGETMVCLNVGQMHTGHVAICNQLGHEIAALTSTAEGTGIVCTYKKNGQMFNSL